MILTTDMIVREAINGAWFLLTTYMVGIFTLHLWPELRGTPTRKKRNKERNKAALGLLLFFAGSAVFHGWIWFLLRSTRQQEFDAWMANSYMVIVGSAVLALIGAIICIMTFSEKRWGHRAWLGAVLLVGIFLAWGIID